MIAFRLILPLPVCGVATVHRTIKGSVIRVTYSPSLVSRTTFHAFDSFLYVHLSANEDQQPEGTNNQEAGSSSSTQPPASAQPTPSLHPSTLAQWPNPTGIFADMNDIDKYVLNERELPVAYDHLGVSVHPSRYSAVFTDGVWAIADVFMHLYVILS